MSTNGDFQHPQDGDYDVDISSANESSGSAKRSTDGSMYGGTHSMDSGPPSDHPLPLSKRMRHDGYSDDLVPPVGAWNHHTVAQGWSNQVSTAPDSEPVNNGYPLSEAMEGVVGSPRVAHQLAAHHNTTEIASPVSRSAPSIAALDPESQVAAAMAQFAPALDSHDRWVVPHPQSQQPPLPSNATYAPDAPRQHEHAVAGAAFHHGHESLVESTTRAPPHYHHHPDMHPPTQLEYDAAASQWPSSPSKADGEVEAKHTNTATPSQLTGDDLVYRDVDTRAMDLSKKSSAPSVASFRSNPGEPSDESRRLAMRSIVTGSPSKVTNANAATEPETVPSTPGEGKKPGSGRQKKSKSKKEKLLDNKKPLQERILTAKKETAQATELLTGKGDLADCLPREDCLLLGRVWIFTVKQLTVALEASANQDLFDEIVSVLAHSRKMSAPKLQASSDTEQEKGGDGSTARNVGSNPFPVDESIANDTAGDAKDDRSEQGVPAAEGVLVSSNSDLATVAREKLDRWTKVMSEFEQYTSKRTPLEQCFRFDGAIQILFPPSFLNFVRSINMKTLWSFLATRKTETGAICELMTIWRRECGLSQVPHLGLARHMLAMATRAETALNALPSVPRDDRLWMKDPINAMTGAARDFLIHDQKIVSAFDFISMRTKDVSISLEEWRAENNMEPLKGSGKVAMISAWKTSVKEALEAEALPGRVVDMSRTMKKVQTPSEVTVGSVAENESRKSTRPSNSQSTGNRNVDNALYSNMFLDDVLGGKASRLLQRAGILTAAELFDAAATAPSDLPLFQILTEAGKVDSTEAFGTLTNKWRNALRQKLDEIGKTQVPTITSSFSQTKSPPTTKKVKRESGVSSSTSTPRPKADRKMSAVQPHDDKTDAIAILSALSKAFLATIGIHTAFDFLSTRSTDIALQFKDWRIVEGKPELKGLGAIASVSGWKSMVRKRAKEMGLIELSELEPHTKGTWISNMPAKKKRSTEADLAAIEILAPGNGLEVDRHELLAVQHRDLPGQFVFDLSLRACRQDAGRDDNFFATYRGFGPSDEASEKAERIEIQSGAAVDEGKTLVQRSAWILADVPVEFNGTDENASVDFRSPFSTFLPGCGLVDIGLHSALPYARQNLKPLTDEILKFVSSGDTATSSTDSYVGIDESHNVLARKLMFDKYQYLLFLTKPVEAGQTFALKFQSLQSSMNAAKYTESTFPMMYSIDTTLRVLCLEDLRSTLHWLKNEALSSTEYKACIDRASSGAVFKEACARRRRIHWVSRRLLAAMGHRSSPDDLGASQELRFSLQTLSAESTLSAEQKAEGMDALVAHMEVEMVFAMDLDRLCGTKKRLNWCTKARDLFAQVVSTVARSYVSQADGGVTELPKLVDLLTSLVGSQDFTNMDKVDDFVFYRTWNSGNGATQIVSKLADATGSANDSDGVAPSRWETVACVGEVTSAGKTSAVMRQPAEVKSGGATISQDWYRGQFWQIVSTIIASLLLNMEREEIDNYDVELILSTLKPIIADKSSIKDATPIDYRRVLPLSLSMTQSEDCFPSSYELFLGLVWPVLRMVGWRLIAGSSQSDVTFCPKPLEKKRPGTWQQQLLRKKTRLAHQVGVIGIGAVSKTTKRVLISVTGDTTGDSDRAATSEAMETDAIYNPDRTVKAILDQFRAWVTSKFDRNEDFSKVFAAAKAVQVVRCVQNCFDACADMLMPIPGLPPQFEDDNGDGVESQRRRPMEAYRSEYLIQFLLLLPTALQQVEQQPLIDTEDCMLVVRDLLAYLAEQHSALFDPRFHPPHEEYLGGVGEHKSQLETKIRILMASERQGSPMAAAAGATSIKSEPMDDGDEAVADEVLPSPQPRELVLIREDEKLGLTDFLVCVQEQGIAFLASAEDVRKKNGRIQLGAPGIVCRHCMGGANSNSNSNNKYEGRYFFSSLDSLTSSYTVLEKHCLRCAKTPVAIKERLAETRLRHAEQRKILANGAQQAYFNTLWARMRNEQASAKHSSTTANFPSAHSNEGGDALDDEEDNAMGAQDVVFTNHIDVLDYVRRGLLESNSKSNNKGKQHAPPNQVYMDEIHDALDRYYSCLEYAGRIYETPSMPRHFSAHWLLSKVAPPPEYEQQLYTTAAVAADEIAVSGMDGEDTSTMAPP